MYFSDIADTEFNSHFETITFIREMLRQCQLNRQASKCRNRIVDARRYQLSIYIEMNVIMTTIRFRNIAYSSSSLSLTRAFSYCPAQPPPLLLYEVLSFSDESVRGNGRFSCCNRMPRGIALAITFFIPRMAIIARTWCLIAHESDHLDTFRQIVIPCFCIVMQHRKLYHVIKNIKNKKIGVSDKWVLTMAHCSLRLFMQNN